MNKSRYIEIAKTLLEMVSFPNPKSRENEARAEEEDRNVILREEEEEERIVVFIVK